MPEYRAPVTDMQYLLQEVFDAQSLWQSMPDFQQCDQSLADTLLDEAAKINEQLIAPLNRAADEQGVSLVDGDVKTPDGFVEAFTQYAQNGWVGLGGNVEYGGQGLPKMLVVLAEEMLSSSGCSFSLYPVLTAGAAFAINKHASETLKQTYLPKLYSGQWAGVMALTESQAGTDLGLMQTKAQPQNDGSYLLQGSKIFITGGDHDLTENIVHLVLAKLPDAPAGSRGISLFLVPKFLVNADGSLGNRNAMHCGALEEKMGIHASSTCVMNYDGAIGFMVGEPNNGLEAMFSMMNYERLSVGIQGLGIAERSYQGAVTYAKERLQSRAPGSTKQGVADPIIDHAEVRRMLMTQKAFIEAGRAFAVYVGLQLDLAKAGDAKQVQKADQLVALLTPVAKAFLTDKGFDVCVLGQQVFGGHGYIREWGMEQLVRDARITQIYEGTNGIQAMDLIGRKLIANNAAFLMEFLAEINVEVSGVVDTVAMQPFVQALLNTVNLLDQITHLILKQTQDNPHLAGAVANDYLHLVGYTAFTYMWFKMAVVSITQKDQSFHDAKIKTGLFFIQRLLPQADALAKSISQAGETSMMLNKEQF